MNREILIIASKYPQPGVAKTRLAVEVGDEMATNIARAMLLDLVSVHRGQSYDVAIVTNSSASVEKFTELFGDIEIRLGMSSCLRGSQSTTFDVFNNYFQTYSKIAMITGDTPGIDSSLVKKSLKDLDSQDVVIGPDYDGGYYLIGMGQPVDLFSRLPETRVPYLFLTIELAIKQQLTQVIEQPLRDIDHLEDIRLINWDKIAVKWPRTYDLVKPLIPLLGIL